ncbi:carbohydrate ABC transporter permease [Streptomyces luteolifulvus]|uniref:Carbohydrate ABC transporter permease n=1 Tax=Streptomyces luteolifulvus TaxID=2615112 RepID=A0A6H9UN70_9ACTN|nr:carbohydrate ABC transporter permease [Streptomyces luteolifulvus]
MRAPICAPPRIKSCAPSRNPVRLGLQDSAWSLVVIYSTITIPVSTWLLIGFLKALPRDIEEQAMVDGYSQLGALLRTVLPLLYPGIVAVVVFAFTLTASEFIYALSFISPTGEKVVSTGVPTELIRGDVFFWQSLQASNGADRGGRSPSSSTCSWPGSSPCSRWGLSRLVCDEGRGRKCRCGWGGPDGVAGAPA